MIPGCFLLEASTGCGLATADVGKPDAFLGSAVANYGGHSVMIARRIAVINDEATKALANHGAGWDGCGHALILAV
jgi:hypothetical protein